MRHITSDYKATIRPLNPTYFFLHRYYHFNVWLLILLRDFSSPPTPSLNQAKRQVTDFISQKCNPQVHNSSCQISFSVSWWVYCGSTQKAEPEKFYNIWHTFNMACELKITACHLPLQVVLSNSKWESQRCECCQLK